MNLLEKITAVKDQFKNLELALLGKAREIEAIKLAKDQEIADLRTQLAAAVAAPALAAEEAEKYRIEAEAATKEIDQLIHENASTDANKEAEMMEKIVDGILSIPSTLPILEPAIELEQLV